MIELEPVMNYRFKIRGPLESTEGSPLGTRQYWEMTEGTLTGSGAERVDRHDTGEPRYRWLNQSLFIARGRLLGTYEVEYDIYRVK